MISKYKIFCIATPCVMLTTIAVTPVAVYCSIDAKTLNVPTKDIIIDPTTGGATLSFSVHDKVQNNEVLVSVINKTHENLVTLFLDGQTPYSSENSLTYPCNDNGDVTIHFSFSKFVGHNIDAVIDLEVNYLNKHGSVRTKFARNMTISTKYEHPEGNLEQIHIYDVNDFHGAAEGYGDDDEDHIFSNVSYKNPGALRLANQLNPLLQQYPGSIFLTAGDNNSGDTFSTSTHGETIYPVLKALGARYSAVGNHAFEWGLDDTASERFDRWARTEQTSGKYFICSNIINHPWYQGKEWAFDPDWNNPLQVETYNEDYTTWKNQRVGWADPYKLINMNGHLVCLLGLTTKTAMSDGNQAVVKSFSFADYAASLYYSTNYCFETIGEEWYNSIETFVILTHVESESREDREAGKPSTAWDLAKDIVLYDPTHSSELTADNPTKKVSAIISGHSHKIVSDYNINTLTQQPISIGQAETAGRQYLDTTLWFDNSKPVGKRWVVPKANVDEIITKPYKVNIDCGGFKPDDPTEKEKALEAATNEIKSLHHNPPNDYVKNVVDVYYDKVKLCKEKLNDVIGYTTSGEAYLPHNFSQIGHAYWPDPETAETLPYNEYVQPMGAWVNYAQIAGFDSEFIEEISSPDSSVTYPAISFFNMDSLTTEFAPQSEIKLANIYDLQGYENSTYFGFLSIWQLANIIDYMLSGANSFVYGSENNHKYVLYPETAGLDHVLRRNVRSGSDITCADDEITECAYLCGPYQWYGFKFKYEVIESTDEQARLDRKIQLHYYEKDGVNYPDIYIYDPGKSPFDSIKSPDKWISAYYYVNDPYITHGVNGLIPCVINSFIYEGGNSQSTMFAKYMQFNERQDAKLYTIHHFSTIARDLIIEFCRLTTIIPPILPFDMEHSISSQLMSEFEN